MIGPFQNEQEIIDELLYWQKRALQAEKEREYYWQKRALQAEKEREYYKAQFLDKDIEIREVIDKFRIELGRIELRRRIVALKYLKGEL